MLRFDNIILDASLMGINFLSQGKYIFRIQQVLTVHKLQIQNIVLLLGIYIKYKMEMMFVVEIVAI